MKTRLWLGMGFALLLVMTLGERTALSQKKGGAPDRAAMSRDWERKGLAEPFKGVTTDGKPVGGLYPVKSTGVSTEPMRKAAAAFLKALSAEQRAKTVFKVNDEEWRKWMNQDFYVRQGVGFEEMSEAQREAAIGMMRASLSAKGLKLTRDIMRLNHTLGELNNNDMVRYGEWKYWLTVMGEPSATEPWGWQLDGHHAIVNIFVLGDQVVATPFFLGSEPVVAYEGKFKGTAILQDEQRKGLELARSLDAAQKTKAVLEVSKPGNNIMTQAFSDNVIVPNAGIQATSLNEAQKKQLVALIGDYVGHMDDGHAKVRMKEIQQHLDQTWFAWIGAMDDKAVFYYRIQNPVLLIEFDHQRPVGMRHLMKDPNVPFRDHIHAVVRTPNGNDYGKDLLRQHHERHPHTD